VVTGIFFPGKSDRYYLYGMRSSNLFGTILGFLGLVATYNQGLAQTIPTCEIISTGMVLHQPPFRQCHASTLVELKDGTILAAFFGGSYEGCQDVNIWGSRLNNGQWSAPTVLADGHVNESTRYPCWNPVLFRTTQDKVYLFYKVGPNPREWFGMATSSDDDGKSWSEPVKLPAGVMGPVKNKPIELRDKRLLCPSSTETETEWKVQMETFDPQLNHWDIVKVDQKNPCQVIQPTILTYPDSLIRILCRSKSNTVITSVSSDQGKNWSRLTQLELPNPNSGIDAVTLRNGTFLLVYNPLISGKEWVNGRNQLNLAWSADGINWSDLMVLEKEETGEFSYPAIIQTSDNLIHITYTYNRNQIKYWKIRL
jgi:alpha-L-fucosidase